VYARDAGQVALAGRAMSQLLLSESH